MRSSRAKFPARKALSASSSRRNSICGWRLFADELLGSYATLDKGSIGAVEGGRWMQRTIAARGLTIAAGSSEIQHNIIGERVLKLPKG